ncbi:general stress protein [Metabacillus arenae]|uniref:General stress protein n=1 Tax=Metabacillus arenae TaxID=2771434 RepID=A0A926N917_9BACI|nr:general stress protein [Metabacillus arenae]MBD1379732.1 general stress protein [Metabacillus arenae]
MKTFIVENGVQASEIINNLTTRGIEKQDIFLFAHDPERSRHLTDGTDTKEVDVGQQGIFDSLANVFRSRGDELRSKMESIGLSQLEAEKMEEEMDHGKVIIVAKEH